MFTPEELAEMAAADAEIDTEFRLTQEDLERSRELDREAKFCALPMKKTEGGRTEEGLLRSQPGEGAGTSPELYAGIPRKKREPPQVLAHQRRQRNSKTPILYGTRKESSRWI